MAKDRMKKVEKKAVMKPHVPETATAPSQLIPQDQITSATAIMYVSRWAIAAPMPVNCAGTAKAKVARKKVEREMETATETAKPMKTTTV